MRQPAGRFRVRRGSRRAGRGSGAGRL